MRILHLAWEYPPLVYGGLGRHVGALSAAQAALGHDVVVVTQGQGDALSNGVRVVRVPSDEFVYSLPRLHTWVGALDHAMGVAAARESADVIHAHDWMVGRGARHACLFTGAPLVATIHATEAGRHRGWLPDAVSGGVHLVEQWLVDEADQVIVCSSAMADEVHRGHRRADSVVIPNGIDVTAYQRTTQIPAELATGSPRLLFVGRLEWEKGVFVAVDAMPAVLREHPHARLRIVGTGGQAAAGAALVQRLGLQSRVELLGHVDEGTLRAVYSSADLLLAPSSYEPFGIVALEAAAMGTPLIVGDSGGLAEFVTSERGRRCPPDDPAALAGQIMAALAAPDDTARRARVAHAALDDYTWRSIAERTVAVYRRAHPTSAPPRQHRLFSRRIW